MRKMWIFVGAIVLLLCLSSCVGTCLVDFALTRQVMNPKIVKKNFKDNEDGSLVPSSDTELSANYNTIINATKEWYKEFEVQKRSVTTFDGLKLVADFIPVENSHKYAILVHGYTSKGEDMMPYGKMFHEWGFNILVPDNRTHGNSEGKYIGMGWLDSFDQLKWIEMITDEDPLAQITMLGVSMGGATVMMTSGLELPSNVKCLIEDCGYDSVWNEFAGQLKVMFHLPTWPVLNWSDRAAKRRAGYSLKEASSVDRLQKAQVPILFIHGTADTFVPYSMLDENIKAIGDIPHEVLRVEDAGHGMAYFKEPQLYSSAVKAFVEKYIK